MHKLSKEQIKNRLEELAILENAEKAKLQALRIQKKQELHENIETPTISQEETEIIQEKFGNKSLEDIKQIVKQEQKNEKMKKLLNKIRKRGLIIGLTGGLSFTIRNYGKQQAKQKINEQTEQEQKKSTPIDATKDLTQKQKITTDQVTTWINKDQIDPIISYENLTLIINNIHNDTIRDKLISYLKKSNII